MIEFKNVTFTYGGAERPALDRIDLRVSDGEFVLVSGDSGSGKSTLLRCINGLVPHFYGGRYGGSVTVNGLNAAASTVAALSVAVGLVFQDSSAQIVTDTVEDEIAFGPRNLGLPAAEVKDRVSAAIADMRLESLAGRRTASLSGGEKQKVAIAAVLSMRPGVLILDEPLAELDPDGAVGLVDLLKDLNRRLGLTVVVAEHRMALLEPRSDRVVRLEAGKLKEGNRPDEIAASAKEQPPRNDRMTRLNDRTTRPTGNGTNIGDAILEVKDLIVSYGPRKVLRGANLTARAGEIVALHGPNGAGKTTLLRTICGFIAAESGSVNIARAGNEGKIWEAVGYVPQRPSALLFSETVAEELAGARHEARGTSLIEEFGLAKHADDYPRDLSLGEQQRVALAAILTKHPALILLDEPTHGLDHNAKVRLAEILRRQAAAGAAIVLATHDEDMTALAATRTVVVIDGVLR
jgi:energy-coupling factor transport system ATP-binding protein